MAENTYSIAIIGNKETILGFKALGLHTYGSNTATDTLRILQKLKNEKISETSEQKKYAIIFVTEDLASEIPYDEYKKLIKDTLPAIIPIPGSNGTKGYGLKRIKKIVEQAIGSDILK